MFGKDTTWERKGHLSHVIIYVTSFTTLETKSESETHGEGKHCMFLKATKLPSRVKFLICHSGFSNYLLSCGSSQGYVTGSVLDLTRSSCFWMTSESLGARIFSMGAWSQEILNKYTCTDKNGNAVINQCDLVRFAHFPVLGTCMSLEIFKFLKLHISFLLSTEICRSLCLYYSNFHVPQLVPKPL